MPANLSWCSRPAQSFTGVGRRFDLAGEAAGITVIDDYAHHPTEIAATLQAARERFPDRRIWAIFQPHTYSRTKALIDDFAALEDPAGADKRDDVRAVDRAPAVLGAR